MVIRPLKLVEKFIQENILAKKSLDRWVRVTSAAMWKSPSDVTNELGSARIIGRNRVIFKISGNRYRLIVEIDYQIGLVDIRFLGTHMEYDKVNALEV